MRSVSGSVLLSRRSFLVAAPLAVAGFSSVLSAHSAPSPAGVTNVGDYEAALKALSRRHAVVLVDIWAEWCKFCRAIDRDILPHPEVQALLTDVGFLKVDVTMMDKAAWALLAHLKADGPPTLFIVDSATGREFSQTRSVGPFERYSLVRRLRPFVHGQEEPSAL